MIRFIIKHPVLAVFLSVTLLCVVVSAWFSADVLILLWRNPASSSLMDTRQAEARQNGNSLKIKHHFVPLSHISPYLKHTILTAEDARFYKHKGMDFRELWEAIKTNIKSGTYKRGASTLTMQLAKNLYLTGEKTLSRKLTELLITFFMERFLSKDRILELYLNFIEWGDGIFGCEAAARAYFHSSAQALTPEQAIRLGTIVINPRRFSPTGKSDRMKKRRKIIAKRMLSEGFLTKSEYTKLTFN